MEWTNRPINGVKFNTHSLDERRIIGVTIEISGDSR